VRKSIDAFRTISEVADELGVQKHVLRFWEAKFSQLKPMKRGGGRRYYRPEDLALLRGIRHLLHNEAYTIKGVQKILREQGVELVKSRAAIGGTSEAAPAGSTKGKRKKAGSGAGIAAQPAAPVAPSPAIVAKPLDAEAAKSLRTALQALEAARATLAKTRTLSPPVIAPAPPSRKAAGKR
jgi:DNA-binding transcriptional MerR regulator